LEYGCIAFDRMAATNMLERIQYRCLRIVLGLIQSTHVQTLRFSMLNHKYLISVFSTGGHPLRRLFAELSRLNSTKMVREFDMVGY
jgi:hypothetical protein